MKRFYNLSLSLRNRLLILVISTISITLLVVFVITILNVNNIVEEISHREAQMIAEQQANEIRETLNAGFIYLRVLSNSLVDYTEFSIPLRQKLVNRQLEKIIRENPNFKCVYTDWENEAVINNGNPRNRFTSTFLREDSTIRIIDPNLEEDIITLDWYITSKNTLQEWMIDPDMYAYEKGSEELLITTILLPIVKDKKFVGVIGIDILLESLDKDLSKLHPYEKGYVVLFSNNGIMLSHPNKSFIGKKIQNVMPDLDNEFQISKNIKDGKEFSFHWKNTTKPELGKTAVFFVPIQFGNDEKKWSLGVVIPDSVIFAKTTSIKYIYAIMSAIALFILYLFIWVITTNISKSMELLNIEKRLVQSQKMESIGMLTGGIAHDFNNILTIVMGYAEILKWRIPKGNSGYDETEKILTASNRAKDLISQLLNFSRPQESKMAVINLTTILKEIVRLLRGSLPPNIEMHTEYPPDTWNMKADPSQIHQVIMNLCINAQHAMPNGGNLKIVVQNVQVDEQFVKKNKESTIGNYVCLIVQDTGIGMDEEVKSKIFEIFFTTKPKGKGTGLGLPTVYSIMKIMNGFILVESEKGKGSTFKIYFPAVFEDSKQETEVDEYLRGSNEIILFVDDEPSIIQLAISMFNNFGYQIMTATNGEEALQLYKENLDKINIIITDINIPKLSGLQLSEEILTINPKAKIILCSGFTSNQINKPLKEIGIKDFLQKPLVTPYVLKSVRRILDEE
jgi:signal transduction histidine kinase/CheY-like chemotaxis protein